MLASSSASPLSRRQRVQRLAALVALLAMLFPLSHADIGHAQSCQPAITIDTPGDNVTLRQPVTMVGWAADLAEANGSGVDAVHVYLDGEAGSGQILGAATIGLTRSDVGAAYGRTREQSGWTFNLDLSNAPVGGHALYVYAHTNCGWTWARQGINVASPDGWALLNPPPPRNSHAAIWNPIDGVMLAVGGRGAGTFADLWSYKPSTETWMPLVGPGVALQGHTAVWDEANAQVLVFGGLGAGSEGAGLWSYRPSTKAWTHLTPQGPAPVTRAYHAAAWDSDSARMLVFGGLGGRFEAYNDVWSYDPATNTWDELSQNRLFTFGLFPEGRFYHSAVWDVENSQLLVFAGANPQHGLLEDIWSFEPGSGDWMELEPVGPVPPARLSQSAVWDPVRSQMLVFAGGCGGCYLDDFWSYSPLRNSWTRMQTTGPAPQSRGGHSGVWDAARGEMLIFGGSALNDLWSFRPASNAWAQRVSRQAPAPATAGHRAIWDPAGNQMLVFGGRSGRDNASPFNVLWSYAPTANVWKLLSTNGPSPSERLGHSVVWDSTGRRAFLYGGSAGDGRGLADLWVYNATGNTWAQLTPDGPTPPARAAHSALWEPSSGQMLVFGGAPSSSAAFDDLWSYNPTTNQWTELRPTGAAPSPRSRHSAIWETTSRQMLVFGGYATSELSTGAYTNELWAYSPASNAWTKLNAAGTQPTARARHAATWDPESGQMLVFGGYVGGVDYLADLWSYRPSTNQWTRLDGAESAEPRSRGDASAVWDPTGAGLLLYGGTGGDVSSEIWSYRPPTSARPAPVPVTRA